jgi:NADH-quinone oxidoreductase subunit J
MAVIVWLTPQGAQEPVENLDSGIRKLGELLFSEYIVPIETIALLLTAALIGAVLIAMRESGDKEQS